MFSNTNQPFRNHQIPKNIPQTRILGNPNRNSIPQQKETPQHDPYMVCENLWSVDCKTSQNEVSQRSIDKKIKVPLLIIGYQTAVRFTAIYNIVLFVQPSPDKTNFNRARVCVSVCLS